MSPLRNSARILPFTRRSVSASHSTHWRQESNCSAHRFRPGMRVFSMRAYWGALCGCVSLNSWQNVGVCCATIAFVVVDVRYLPLLCTSFFFFLSGRILEGVEDDVTRGKSGADVGVRFMINNGEERERACVFFVLLSLCHVICLQNHYHNYGKLRMVML